MRNTRWIPLLGREARRVALAVALCGSGWGCHQHHYYYGTPMAGAAACPPGTAVLPSAVNAAGPVCDVSGDGPIITSNSGRSTTVSDGRKSRVVVSEPSGGKSLFGWRPSDPEDSPAMTQVDGAINDSSVRK